MSSSQSGQLIGDLVATASVRLTAAGVADARLNAESILAHVVQLPRLRLLIEPFRRVGDSEVGEFQALVEERCKRRPLQHVLGCAPFLDWDFEVNSSVLVPRPETEQLLLWVLDAVKLASKGRALDFGTGSGCLAIALSLRLPEWSVDAVDISEQALAVARRNAARLGAAGRVRFFQGDGFGGLPAGQEFDLIVSNPPYIPSGEIEGLEPEVRDHDPRLALDGGGDGLVFYRRLAVEGLRWLRPGGMLAVEFGDGQAADIRNLFSGEWLGADTDQDLSGRERFLKVRRK